MFARAPLALALHHHTSVVQLVLSASVLNTRFITLPNQFPTKGNPYGIIMEDGSIATKAAAAKPASQGEIVSCTIHL